MKHEFKKGDRVCWDFDGKTCYGTIDGSTSLSKGVHSLYVHSLYNGEEDDGWWIIDISDDGHQGYLPYDRATVLNLRLAPKTYPTDNGAIEYEEIMALQSTFDPVK